MAKNKQKDTKLEVVPYRFEGQDRIYSNYVRVMRMREGEISLQFCDVQPPPSDEELEQVKKTGKVVVPIAAEVVLPVDVAEGFLKALASQLGIIPKEKK
jgi:hypothetical protein